jgi:two-component system, LytTR family, sensor kinase
VANIDILRSTAMTPAGDTVTVPRGATGTRPSWLRLGWPLYLVLAALFGSYMGLNAFIGLHSVRPDLAAWQPFVWEWSSILVIVALIPVIVGFEERFRVDARPRRRIVAAHAVGAVAFSIAHTTGMVLLRKLVYALGGQTYDYGNLLVGAFYELQKDVLTYLVILTVIFAVREFRIRRAGELRAAELAAELSTARIRFLTTQIEPHFLFNSLNAISNRMHEDVDAADRMISQLGDLLRAAYATDQQVLVPLGHELGWLRGYAAMMGERFRGQLSFELDVEPGLEGIEVPRLLLQPLVENAFKHGLGEGRGHLHVDVRRSGERLRYTVTDDGVGLPDLPMKLGTGLQNVANRLELLFPGDHTLNFARREPGGTTVTATFPAAG